MATGALGQGVLIGGLLLLREKSQSTKTVISLLNADISSQGRNEGTSSVAFEVLIINFQIYLINLFISTV